MNKWLVIGISIIVSTFIAANAILLFEDNSEIARTYYLKEHETVQTSTYSKELEKESVVVPTEAVTITIDTDQVSNLVVSEGDEIGADSELAQLKPDFAEQQRAIWETEVEAYRQEQMQLNQIIGDLEYERSNAEGTYTDTNTATNNTNDDVTDVNVQVDVQLSQDGSYSQAIGTAKQKLAEVDRQLQIMEAQLSQEPGAVSLLSPIAGTVGAIESKDGKYFIEIYSQEKSLLTFVPEKEWHKLDEGMLVKNYSSHNESINEGTIAAITQVPANGSPWLSAYKQYDSESKDPLYEVRIQLNEQPERLPFAANINSAITTDQVDNAVSLKTDWLLNSTKEKAELYVLTTEGKIAKTAVTIPFYLNKHTVVTTGLENGTTVLEDEPKAEAAPAFLPFPMETPSWKSIKAVSWKDYVKYLTYK